MPEGASALPTAGRTRRAGDAVPILREAVQAVVEGQAIAWDDAEERGRTPLERSMTRQLRDLSRLAGFDASDPMAPPSVLPSWVVVATGALATVQAATGITAALWLAWQGEGLGWRTALPLLLALAAGLAWRVRRARMPGAADLLILLAAWAGRGALETLAALSAPWAWLTAPLRIACVEAALPLMLMLVVLARVSRPRFTRRDTFGRWLAWAACGCTLVLAPAVVSRWLPLALPFVAAVWASVGLALLWRWGRGGPPASGVEATPRVARWSAIAKVTASDAWAAWRGTHTTRLAALTAGVHRARTLRELAALLTAQIVEATGASRAVIVIPGEEAWTAVGGEGITVPSGSAVAALLDGADSALRVDAASRTFGWLPDADRRWVADVRAGVVARLAAPDGQTLGGLVVGLAEDGRACSRRDLAFVSAAAGIAGVAMSALVRANGTTTVAAGDEEEVPYECEACGRLSPEAARCACGGATILAALPAVLNGAFVLERRIGRGGMGVVYRAHDTRLDRLVALKTLPALPSAALALQAEARAMAALEHPSVASVHGLETWRGTPVLVVEYLAGGTLATRIASGPMRPGEAVALAHGLAEALAALHARGWLHGDIKPSNIGLTRDGVPKLLDFGLTRWQVAAPGGAEQAGLAIADGTRSGPLAGTPLYLSPDALEGRPGSESDDVWALALVIVELLTGVHPFRGGSPGDVATRIRTHGPVDVRRSVPATPAWLAEVLAAALHPDRAQRIIRARALADALASPPGHAAATVPVREASA